MIKSTGNTLENRGVNWRGIRLARVAKQERLYRRIYAVCLKRLHENNAVVQ